MLRHRLFPSVLLGALAVGACTTLRDVEHDPSAGGDDACYGCHGTVSNGNAAPPPALAGTETTLDPHQSHLRSADWHGPMACETCHTVPARTSDPGHIDSELPAEVVFGDLAIAGGLTPRYVARTQRCNNTYCHGATLSGGSLINPTWQTGDEDQAACGTCHSLPPNQNHPADAACERCHGTVIAAGHVFVDPAKHVNGVVDSVGTACDSCHGHGGISAPPRDVAGNSTTTARGVGAHRQHFGTSSWHAPVPCNECHVVPAHPDAPGHYDTPGPAELVFGTRAKAGGTMASWDPNSETCTVYCHGIHVGAEDGVAIRPVWTQVDGTQSTCGACHALPPGGNHPPRQDCSTCHGAVIAADGTFTSPERHVDGTVDLVPVTCNLCHGDAAAPADQVSAWAPPTDVRGRSDAGLASVGAHQKHLETATWHRQVLCEDCHDVPATMAAPGHLGPSPAEVPFGTLARSRSASPSYDPAAHTCSDSYCHGSRLAPSTAADVTPDWLEGTSGGACGTACHSLPPDPPRHPAGSDCETCHGSVVDTAGFIRPELHINGVTNFD